MFSRLKYAPIGTPFEPVAVFAMHRLSALFKTARNPELAPIFYESALIDRAIRELARPDMNCIDVGAHVGVITSKLLRYAPRGAHLAVEPTPWKAERLKRLFPRVGVHACALGARPGRANFSENVRRPALSRLARADGGASSNDIRTYEVEIKTLDMIALEAPKTGFIKIDAEGAEPDVIRGGSGLIARDRPAILFEWGADEEETARLRPDPYQVLTGEFGYDVYSIRSFIFGRRKLNHYDFDVCRTYPATAFNFVALPGG